MTFSIRNKIKSLLFFSLCAFVGCSLTPLYSGFDSEVQSNGGVIFLFKGSCSSGKSTIIRHLGESTDGFVFVDEDSIVYEKYVEAIARRFSSDFQKIAAAITENNIYPALRYKNIFFKSDATTQECLEAEDALQTIQAELNSTASIPWKKEVSVSVSKEVVKRVQEALNIGKHVIVDSWYISGDDMREMFPEVKIIQTLVYCPFPVAYQRFVHRNKESIQTGNLQEFRQIRQLLSFFSLYHITHSSKGAVQSIDVGDMNRTLDLISAQLEGDRALTAKPVFTFEEISRTEFDWFRSNYGDCLEGSDRTTYIVANEHYDLIIDTSRDDLEEAAAVIFTKVENL